MDKNSQGVNITQRIVGGLVLVAIAVIVIPMVLDLRKDRTRITSTNIPSKPPEYRVEVLTLKDEKKMPERVEIPSISNKIVTAAEDNTKKTKDAEKVTKNEVQKPNRPDLDVPAPEAWVVQLGSFSQEKNALELRNRLRNKGYVAYIDKVVVDDREVIRVRVGPEVYKSKTEEIRKKLANDMDLEGFVVSLY